MGETDKYTVVVQCSPPTAEKRLGAPPPVSLFTGREVPVVLLSWLEEFLAGAGYSDPAKREQALRLVKLWQEQRTVPYLASLCGAGHPVPSHPLSSGEPSCPVCKPL